MSAVTLQGNEIIWVQGIAEDGYPSPVLEQTTTGAIAALGGGGGFKYEQLFTTGLNNNTPNAGTNVLWNVAATGVKTNGIPAAVGSMEVIVITDVLGTAGQSNNYIQAVPVSGSVVGNNTVYTDNGSITLYDSKTLMAWVSQ